MSDLGGDFVNSAKTSRMEERLDDREKFRVFFSHPLDLDFSLLKAFAVSFVRLHRERRGQQLLRCDIPCKAANPDYVLKPTRQPQARKRQSSTAL